MLITILKNGVKVEVNFTEAEIKLLPVWMLPPQKIPVESQPNLTAPREKLIEAGDFSALTPNAVDTQVDIFADCYGKKAKNAKAGTMAKTGETFHLQQDFANGRIYVGRWKRSGNEVAVETCPNYRNDGKVYTRKMVQPLQCVEAGTDGTLTTLIVEECAEYQYQTQYIGLFKLPAENVADLIASNKVKAHKILTLDGQAYLRCSFAVMNWLIPAECKNTVTEVGTHAGAVQIASAKSPAPANWEGPIHYELTVSAATSVSAGLDLISYLDCAANKRAKEAAIVQAIAAQ